MSDVSVVIAYRDMGCEHRRRSFEYVTARLVDLGWDLHVEAGDEDFTRASALNTVINRATGRVIVQCDPDSLVPIRQLSEAVKLAAAADGLVIPHDRYCYLTQETTARVYAGAPLFTDWTERDCDHIGGGGSGNVVVFSKTTWEQAGGYDERFGLWAGDDAAFRYSSDALVGPTRRLPGDVVHLWHPRLPQSVPGGPGYSEQFAILAQYRDAALIGPEAVRTLVESR